ncbi:MAG: DUF669 domain-containing protein [Candidatus Marinimicrobia bacterium]|jgi:hypothetical protein|nr:DUF669 domain-containing protein [Gammaproteobacteria bacterium]MBT4944689.1 DUF669 domain-containing protein [Candidatus Neomarinimicrobiota bacterium]MBT7478133.1 DUF669 domain-containing protein [Gammaproteobacteria bacterium]HIJ23075.1 DUF669 domain-containing protein [Gammaproteobacteria bacterium]
MADIGNFDATTVAPNSSAAPAGIYKAIITDSEGKPTAKGSGILLKMQIVEGPFQGHIFTEFLNMQHSSSPVAERISKQTLSSICHVTGKMQVSNTTELHDIPFAVKLSIEDGGSYPDKNKVKEWLMVDGSKIDSKATPATASAPASKEDDDIPF